MTGDALSPAEFAAHLNAAMAAAKGSGDMQAPLALAVSGGADSMAMAVLAAEALGAARVTALTVDHGLRPETAAEVAATAARLARLAIPHVVLRWEGAKPDSGVQAAARQARYRLLEDWCVARARPWLVLAHHQEDQAETLLLRLARGSGVDGLCAMAGNSPPLSRWDGPRRLRPLLEVAPERLRAALRARGIDWVEDPSNDNPDFDRVKVRRLLADPPLAGLNAARLAATARTLARARQALETYASRLWRRAVTLHPSGHASLDAHLLADEPQDSGLRLLARLLAVVGGRPLPPRFAHLAPLFHELVHAGGAARTLAGCLIAPEDAGRVLVTREPAAVRQRLALHPGGAARLWDGRFLVTLGDDAPPGDVAGVGKGGVAQIRAAGADLSLADLIAQTQPGLWQGEKLVAAPTLGYYAQDIYTGFKARFAASAWGGFGDGLNAGAPVAG